MATTAHVPLLDGRPHLTVGIITADLGHLADEVGVLADAGVEIVHIDVMDGVFCPMTTVGPPFIKAIRTPLLKDVHLMIHEPLEKVGDYVAAGADMVTFHVEGASHPHRVLRVLGGMTNANDPDRGIIRGAAIDPGTPVSAFEPLLDELEYLLLLAVDPGWGGQRFIASTERRFVETKALVERSGRPIAIGIDGGITADNVASVAALGPNVIVTGSAVFDGKDAPANARRMLELAGASRRAVTAHA
jgi:ribulose-phosphate 3-epimerase